MRLNSSFQKSWTHNLVISRSHSIQSRAVGKFALCNKAQLKHTASAFHQFRTHTICRNILGSPNSSEKMSSAQDGETPLMSSEAQPAGTESSQAQAPAPQNTDTAAEAAAANPSETTEAKPMSKNALKRLRKAQEWEDGKDDRRKRRKEKRHERKGRQRERRNELLAQGVDRSVVFPPKRQPGKLVPVSLVLDCDFESYMMEKELISLSSQVVRSYSDNRLARYKSYLSISGWKGKLLERFQTTLGNSHKSWRNVSFEPGDFVEAALRAEEKMKIKGGEMIEPLQKSLDHGVPWVRDETDPIPLPDPEPEPKEEYKNIVYLTSDSPYTLDRLEPNTSYIIGGLVDHNREKGLCYRRARERGIRTARLPIGDFMVMQSRQVLATNHVVDIMLKWLEYEDWGEAFTKVIPKRKGGVLKGEAEGEDEGEDGEEEEHDGGETELLEEDLEGEEAGEAEEAENESAPAPVNTEEQAAQTKSKES